MKTQLILLTGVMCTSGLSTTDAADSTPKFVNEGTLIIETERNEKIINHGKCQITTGKVNNSATNCNAKAVLEIQKEESHIETLNNEAGTVKQNAGTVTTATNEDIYDQTGGTVTNTTNTGNYNINNAEIAETITNNDNDAKLKIDGEETHITKIDNGAGTVIHANGSVDVVRNFAKDDNSQSAYDQHGGTIGEIVNDAYYIYRNGAVNKFNQSGSKASLKIVDNAKFELTEGNTVTNGAIVLGTSGDEPTIGTLILNNGIESKAQVTTNANSQLIVNEGSALNAQPKTNVMANSLVDVKGTAHFEGIDNDTENVVAWGGAIKVGNNGVFRAINVNEHDGIGEDDKTHATLEQAGGVSNINAFVTLGENTSVTGGVLNAQGNIGFHGNMTTGDNKATFNLIGYDSVLHIKGGAVTLDGGSNLDRVNWEGNLFLDGGTLTLKNIIDNSTEGAEHINKTGFLTARRGNLFIQGETVLLNENDYIYDDVNLKVDGNIEVQEDGTMHVSGDDEYKGRMFVTGGQLFLKNITTGGDTYLQTTAGLVEVKQGSKLVLNDDRDQIIYNTILDLKGDLEIDNNNTTGVTLNNIGTGSDDNWEANIELKKGVLTLENVSKSTTDTSKYNQSEGNLRLFKTSLTLNEGSKLNGGSVSFGVPLNNSVPPEGDRTDAVIIDDNPDNNGGNNNNGGPLHASAPAFLHAPVKRIKNIEKQRLMAGNTGLLRTDPNPIRLRADQNQSELAINNGENNNIKVNVDTTNTDVTISVSGVKSSTNTPTTFTFNEGSNMEAGAMVVGDDNGSANVVSTSNNTVITEDVSIAIKGNTTLNVNGDETKVTFNSDNVGATLNGTLKQSEGTVTLLGTKEKTGVIKSTGGLLNIGDGVTETEVVLNNDNDRVSGDAAVVINPNTTFDFSGNQVDVPIENRGTLKVTSGNISYPIKSGITFTGGTRLRGRTILGYAGLTGRLEVRGDTSSSAEISQETVAVTAGTKFSTTADVTSKKLEMQGGSLIDIKNSNIISDNLTGDSTNEYKLDNANLFLKDQDADINGEVTTSGNKVILYINDKKFNDCVNVTPGCNTYLVSGQIGSVTIPWGARLTADSAGAAATNDDVVEAGGDVSKNGTLIVEKNDTVKGDLVLGNDATIKIQNKNIVFHNKSTYDEWQTKGQRSPTAEVPGPYFKRTGNGKIILENSIITIPYMSLLTGMENIELIGSSKIIFGGGDGHIDNFLFSETFTTTEGEYINYDVRNNMTMGKASSDVVNFEINLYARSNTNKKHNTFGSDTAKLIAGNGSNATINISDWLLHGELFGNDAPIDRNISMQIFKFGSTQDGHKFTFTSSDKEILTAIGYYKLNSKGNGLYSFDLSRYNPGVFRGQIVTTAQLQNQHAVDNTVFDHIMAEPSVNNNDYALNKDGTKNRYLWTRMYGGKEKLHLNQDFDVDNNTYGVITGIDFNSKFIGNDWFLTPSVFMAYNHAKQKYNDNYSSRQEGGQFGLATVASNGKIKFGAVAYGGYYTNKMAMPNDVTDKVNNWFGGASMRGSYGVHISKKVMAQPYFSLAYNHFGAKNWKTDFGNMDMNLTKLNGISIAPGVNIFLKNSMFDLCGSIQYVRGIDKGVSGQAGNVKLPEVKLKKGYMQYGLGLNRNFTKNLSCNLQATMRQLGRTGFGVRAGINWRF